MGERGWQIAVTTGTALVGGFIAWGLVLRALGWGLEWEAWIIGVGYVGALVMTWRLFRPTKKVPDHPADSAGQSGDRSGVGRG